MEKITDKEIIKALGCCSKMNNCRECVFWEMHSAQCVSELLSNTLDLIKRQKAEIERLQKRLELAEQCITEVEDAAYRGGSNDYIDSAIDRYNNLVKEMTEKRGNENKSLHTHSR